MTLFVQLEWMNINWYLYDLNFLQQTFIACSSYENLQPKF